MILKEWSEAQDIYKATRLRYRKALGTIRTPSKWISYWYLWGAYLVLIILSLLNVFLIIKTDSGQWAGLFMWFSILTFLLIFGAREKALAKAFAAEYKMHKISHYPFWKRGTYFIYALFLHELKDQRYSYEKVARLSEIAELATPPEPVPVRYVQNPIITYLMVVIMALVVNFISTSPVWQSDWRTKAIILCLAVTLLGIVIVGLSLWYPLVTYRTNQHQRISRYLQWAERDLREEQLF